MQQTLYLGLEPSRDPSFQGVHFPIITIKPFPIESPDIQDTLTDLEHFTLLIFTSKIAVQLFHHLLEISNRSIHSLSTSIKIVAVGKVTATYLDKFGFSHVSTAKEETAEGVVELLSQLNLDNPYILWPHSALSRPVLPEFFESRGWRYKECILYDTVTSQANPLPDLSQFHTIVFTSPSTVDAFLVRYGAIPLEKQLVALGPITQERLDREKRF